MSRIKVTINNGTHGQTFETLNEANNWIANQESKPFPWGYKKERWLTEDQFTTESIETSVDQRQVESIDGIGVIEYKFNKEYNIAIEEDLLFEVRKKRDELAAKGKALKELANKIIYIIAGHNQENELDLNQIIQIKQRYSTIFQLLSDGQPMSAKILIDQVVPDGVLITQEELDHVQLEYADFFAAHGVM